MPYQIKIRVMPRAKFDRVEMQSDGTYRIHTTAAPTDGDANAAVIKMLARHLDIPKSSIKIVRGQLARDKVIEVQ